jgi:hypothetical protein
MFAASIVQVCRATDRRNGILFAALGERKPAAGGVS